MRIIRVIVPASSMEDKWFRDVPSHVLSFLASRGIELPFNGISLSFECLVQHRFSLIKNSHEVGMTFGVIENAEQSRLFDALMAALQGEELDRKVVLL